METPYSKRELDHNFNEIKESLNELRAENKEAHEALDANQKRTNGKLFIHTKILLVFGAVVATLLITNGSEMIKLFKLIIWSSMVSL